MIGHDFITCHHTSQVQELIQGGSIGNVVSFSYLVNAPIPKDWIESEEPGWYADLPKLDMEVSLITQYTSLISWIVYEKEGKRVFRPTGNLVHKSIKVDDYVLL